MKYFFIANFIDNEISNYLNAIKYIAEPTNFSIAHITLKGPFKTQQKKQFESVKKQLENKEVQIVEIGNFFDDNQNTVYLRCVEDPELYQIWKSKTDRTYQNYHPHITIYDGKDTAFSRDLYDILKKYSLKYTLKIDEIDLYNKGKKKEMFYKEEVLNMHLLRDVVLPHTDNNSTDITEIIENITKEHRLTYIENITKKLCNR